MLNHHDSKLMACHLSQQVVYLWTETWSREREGAVQVEGGGGGDGGGSEAADTDEWHQPEKLHQDSEKKYEHHAIYTIAFYRFSD